MKTYIQSSTKCKTIFSINMIYKPMLHFWRSKNRSVFLRPCFKNRGCDEGLTHQILYNLIRPLHLQFLLDIFRISVSKQNSGRKIYTPTTTTCVVCSEAEKQSDIPSTEEKTAEWASLGKASWGSQPINCLPWKRLFYICGRPATTKSLQPLI